MCDSEKHEVNYDLKKVYNADPTCLSSKLAQIKHIFVIAIVIIFAKFTEKKFYRIGSNSFVTGFIFMCVHIGIEQFHLISFSFVHDINFSIMIDITLSLFLQGQGVAARLKPGNAKGGSITVPLTSCLTGLDSAV